MSISGSHYDTGEAALFLRASRHHIRQFMDCGKSPTHSAVSRRVVTARGVRETSAITAC